MPKYAPDSVRFEMRATAGWLETVDQWRAKQPGIPPRAEAIRRLVQIGLETENGRQKNSAADKTAQE